MGNQIMDNQIMDNPAKLSTLGTQDTVQTHHTVFR
jgi:hypothetical protein